MRVTITPKGLFFKNSIKESNFEESNSIINSIVGHKRHRNNLVDSLKYTGLSNTTINFYLSKTKNLLSPSSFAKNNRNIESFSKQIQVKIPRLRISPKFRTLYLNDDLSPKNNKQQNLNFMSIQENTLKKENYIKNMLNRLNKGNLIKIYNPEINGTQNMKLSLERKYDKVIEKFKNDEESYILNVKNMNYNLSKIIRNQNMKVETFRELFKEGLKWDSLEKHKMNLKWKQDKIKEIQEKKYKNYWSNSNLLKISEPKERKNKFLNFFKK